LYDFLPKKPKFKQTLNIKISNLREKNLTYKLKKVNGVWLWKLICYWSVVWSELEEILDLGDLREIFEIFLDFKWQMMKWGVLPCLKQHVVWVK